MIWDGCITGWVAMRSPSLCSPEPWTDSVNPFGMVIQSVLNPRSASVV